MPSPLVSVIVPTFNRAYCLQAAVDSALAQTHRNIEVIIVDDGSTDGTRQLVEERYAAEPRVRYAYQQNAGVATARNLAMELAQGDYVAFLDSDDTWEPWKIELQSACMASNPELVMVWSDMRARGPQGEITEQRYLRKMYGAFHWFTDETLFSRATLLCQIVPALAALVGDDMFLSGDIYSAMVMGSLVHTSTVLLKRSVALLGGGFNAKYRIGEDYDFHIRTCKRGPVGLVDIPTISYQLGMPDRMTRSELRLLTAQNFLDVVTRELDTESDRISLPDRMKRAVLADAHQWIGYEFLDFNDTRQARHHFARSLHYAPWQPQTLWLLSISCLPAGAFKPARHWFRRLRGVLPSGGPDLTAPRAPT